MKRLFLITALLTSYFGIAESKVFEDACWIGVPSDNLPLYSDYLPVFKIDCDVNLSRGPKASLIYGANDPRLMNSALNVFSLASPKDSTAIKITLEYPDKVSVYRYGYHPDDNPNVPKAIFPANVKKGNNHLTVESCLGFTIIYLNGIKVGETGLNPNGRGGDYLAFPVLADMAVEIPSASKAEISDIRISNFRDPGNTIYYLPKKFTADAKIELPVRSMPELRRKFSIPKNKKVKSAKITATARGIYDLSLNGSLVCDDYFNPGSTQYNKTHLYHTFDITPYIKEGENILSAQLSEGWWSGGSTYTGENWNFFGDRQSFIASLIIDYSDGTSETIVTSPDRWEYSVDGPVVEGSFFQGEIYDASRKDADDRVWLPAVEISTDSTVCRNVGSWENIDLRESFGDRVIAVDTITAIYMSEPRPGIFVYDMGQNMAAVPLISFPPLKKGEEITMRYAEVLYPDLPQYSQHKGMIMTENLRAAMCRDIYHASGNPEEVFSPRHTLHGFRYLEITGVDKPLPLESVKAVPVSSIHGFKAHFECSDPLVNRLWENIKWSSLGNFISIPTDCPQRNERLGWMGDISVFSPTATKIADVSHLLRQYLTSVRDCQSEEGKFPDVAPTGFGIGGFLWGSAGITVPWEFYRQYGDIELLKVHYPSMKKYIDFVYAHTMDPATGIMVQNREWGDLADWLSPEYDKTDKSLLWECYLIYDLGIMEKVAGLLGEITDAENYSRLKAERTQFFKDTYIDKNTRKTVFSDFNSEKKGSTVDTQVSYALPIAMDICREPEFVENFIATIQRENIADNGVVCPPYSLMTGFIGTAWILHALSDVGRQDLAYKMLTNTSYPSWLYPVTQGATTVWERLDSYTHEKGFGKNNSMNSFNHYSFGAVGDWLLSRCLGIDVRPDGSVAVNPEADPTGGVTYAKGWIDTPWGRVSAGWHIEDGKVKYDIDIPDGMKTIPNQD